MKIIASLALSIFILLFPATTNAELKQNPYYKDQYYLNKVNFLQYVAWQFPRGEGVVVAVIDDGVWLQHPDLKGSNWVNDDEILGNGIDNDNNGYIDDVYGWNFIDDNHDLTTKGSHGTAIAGIIAAQDNGIGIVGIAPDAKIMPLIVCNSDGCSKDAISRAIVYATSNGADIINISLGSENGYIGYTEDLNDAITRAYARGVIIVAAAGNGDTESSGYYGAQAGMDLDFYSISPVNNDTMGWHTIIGVGALDKMAKYRTSWSNYGKGVDIYAPGEEIMSTIVPLFEGGYGYSRLHDGTSFSAPMISATAALLISYAILSRTEIVERIIKQANDGVLDIVNTLKGIYITKRRDYQSSQPTPTPQPAVPQEPQDKPDTTVAQPPEETSQKEGSVTSFIQREKDLAASSDTSLSDRLSGKILLQVEESGEGWYVNPDDQKKYYLGRPADAFRIMRELGLGISEASYNSFNGYAPARLAGKILLRVEADGEAYYVNPTDLKMHYLGRPADAFQVMRNLGLGITNSDIRKIDVGEI